MQAWLHLLYKIPRNPSKTRVYVWRKLKRLGAFLLHESVWCLPANSKTKEQFQWLALEIEELGGEASVWEAQLVSGHDGALREAFLQQVDQEYGDILEELKKEDPDLVLLSNRYKTVRTRDYFNSQLGNQVREQLLAARRGEHL